MKHIWLPLVGAVWFMGWHPTLAQTNLTTHSETERTGQVVVPERPTAIDANTGPITGVAPPVSDRPQLPPEVSARIERFRSDARAYLAQQQLLTKKWAGASDQERAALRDQLRSLREKWLERSRELREEYKDRKAELELKLRDHRELFDEIRGAAAEKRRDGGERPRRGSE